MVSHSEGVAGGTKLAFVKTGRVRMNNEKSNSMPWRFTRNETTPELGERLHGGFAWARQQPYHDFRQVSH